MTETVTAAVEKRDSSPAALVRQYSHDFETVLPSHIKPATWVRVAQGALKRGKMEGNRYQLEIAAENNTPAFLAALLEAARLGLEPGTEQYYLTPRKVRGRLEILGIVGYQGEIELMYRAGAVSSVVAEVVHDKDVFHYRPGLDPVPVHEIDWTAEDRGDRRLVYAYARMKDGAVSRVCILNNSDIEKIKRTSDGAGSEYSPWQKWPEQMWLKSAVHQLAKWVPTSAEYIREQLRAIRDVQNEQPVAPAPSSHAVERVDTTTGEIVEGELVDTAAPEIAEGDPDTIEWPVTQPGSGS